MKTLKLTLSMIVFLVFSGMNESECQWINNVNNIFNSNSGNVGIGNGAPTTLLHVGKLMTEPTITVQNLGGSGGATYTMMDQVSGANWKFKATNTGGFKIRDHGNLMDVIIIEPNSFANAIYIKTTDNIGIGTATPHSSAMMDITSTTKGFLPPRMTQAQIVAIESPADGLIVYCTTDGKYYAYVSMAEVWKEILFGSGIIQPYFLCGTPVIKSHVAGAVAPVTKAVTYGTVNNIPGEPSKCWIASNLGADQQATAVNDATEESAGWYWQFNRQQGYKSTGSDRIPNTTWISSISEDSHWLTANDPCALLLGSGWRLPTSTEWTNVDASGGWTNWNGPWNSALKMHAAGYLQDISGGRASRGSLGYYWSSTQHDNSRGGLLYFSSGNCNVNNNDKAYGYSARCLRD